MHDPSAYHSAFFPAFVISFLAVFLTGCVVLGTLLRIGRQTYPEPRSEGRQRERARERARKPKQKDVRHLGRRNLEGEAEAESEREAGVRRWAVEQHQHQREREMQRESKEQREQDLERKWLLAARHTFALMGAYLDADADFAGNEEGGGALRSGVGHGYEYGRILGLGRGRELEDELDQRFLARATDPFSRHVGRRFLHNNLAEGEHGHFEPQKPRDGGEEMVADSDIFARDLACDFYLDTTHKSLPPPPPSPSWPSIVRTSASEDLRGQYLGSDSGALDSGSRSAASASPLDGRRKNQASSGALEVLGSGLGNEAGGDASRKDASRSTAHARLRGGAEDDTTSTPQHQQYDKTSDARHKVPTPPPFGPPDEQEQQQQQQRKRYLLPNGTLSSLPLSACEFAWLHPAWIAPAGDWEFKRRGRLQVDEAYRRSCK